MTAFTTKDGITLHGTIVHVYGAFEGNVRYIFETEDGKQYRCIKVNGQYKEYAA